MKMVSLFLYLFQIPFVRVPILIILKYMPLKKKRLEDLTQEELNKKKTAIEIEQLSIPAWRKPAFLGIFLPLLVSSIFGAIAYVTRIDENLKKQAKEAQELIEEQKVQLSQTREEKLHLQQKINDFDRVLLEIRRDSLNQLIVGLEKEYKEKENELFAAQKEKESRFKRVNDSFKANLAASSDKIVRLNDELKNIQEQKRQMEADVASASSLLENQKLISLLQIDLENVLSRISAFVTLPYKKYKSRYLNDYDKNPEEIINDNKTDILIVLANIEIEINKNKNKDTYLPAFTVLKKRINDWTGEVSFSSTSGGKQANIKAIDEIRTKKARLIEEIEKTNPSQEK